ncbi:acyl-CoA synthetase [Brevibacterium album]|uniref:acyl-CoA synthetase n=1 Tax=Brevibacterium album TaxID=417948 RepID=UPI0006874CDD|nr:long-chain fatty acid--CoA ligase [Brevibacterium album]
MSVPLGTWPAIHALRIPDRPALVDGDTGRVLTYAELEARTTRLAAALRNRGVGPGDRVAVLSLNCPEMLKLVFAVAKLGAITVMLNFRLTAPEIAFILKDSGASLLFATTSLEGAARTAAEDSEIREVVTLATAQERRDGIRAGFDALLDSRGEAAGPSAAGADPAPAEQTLTTAGPTAPDLPEVDPESPAVLMYTSGTTGRPKGAILTHSNLFWVSLYHNSIERGLNRLDVNLAVAPLFHIGALAVYTLPGAYWGACTVVLESFDPETWAAAVERHRVTKAFAVPVMWGAVLQSGATDRHDVSSLDVAVSGGAPCPLPVIEGLLAKGVAFTEGFGLTETAAAASMLPSEFVRSHAGSVGRPLPHVEFRVVDAGGAQVPVGEVGELLVRGPSVSPGYWNRPDANAEAFRDGWFHTGDLARVDADGLYHLVDRKKDMVITGGENVYPIEVEQVLYGHPAVAEVAVIGAPDAQWGEAVTAVVVRAEAAPSAVADEAGTAEDEALAAELTAFARERLAGFKVPKRFVFADALPRTATGKVRKVELRSAVGGQESMVSR